MSAASFSPAMEQIVEAAQLNRRILIQQQSSTPDAVGQPLLTWTTVYTCWAGIDALSAQLLYQTDSFISRATSLITIRYTSSQVFNNAHQIVYVEPATAVTHTYQIKAILNKQQRNRRLAFLCYEVNPDE